MKKIILAISVSAALITGCTSTDIGAYKTGTEVTQEQLGNFKIGESTQTDITQTLGQPERKQALNDKEIWYYDFTKIRHIGANVSESTVFEFDKSKKLIQSYKTGSNGNTGNALIDASKGN